MDFDLNQAYNHEFPSGFNTAFEDDIFQGDNSFERLAREENDRQSPNRGSHYNDAEGEEDTRCGVDECRPSSLHRETDDASGEEELEAQDENFNCKLIAKLEKTLGMGSKLDSLDQIYLLYVEYGRLMGFSVKKGGQKYSSKSHEVRVKEYLCSCEGKSNAKNARDRLPQYRKQDFRCMCTARIRVIRDSDQKWCVTIFNKMHNHEMAGKEHSYLLRSCRTLSHAQKTILEAMHSVGIRMKDAFRFMVKESGGHGNTGFIRKDVYHHMDQVRRKSKLVDADSNSIVQHFIEKSNKEPFFYWNMQTDDEGRLMNFFFRDTRYLVDYELFGDVLSVDTTYKTNKYELICAPFVGVNHHMKNCMFGLAFLSDETTETFNWLFSTFLESMNGQEPDIVFTDQCQAMMNSIDAQFKTCTHRLCQWPINQNAPSHFGSLNGSKEFKKTWFHCMNGCESIDEFESTWNRIMLEYGLVDNSWFRSMYKLRSRWASVFSQDRFCAGLHATSRSENTNKVLKDISSRQGSLYEFVQSYEQIQLEWRRREGEDDTSCLGTPGLLVQNNPLLKHAANFFTRSVFLSYEYEATHSLNVDILRTIGEGNESNETQYVVTCGQDPTRIRRVSFNKSTSEANCSCCLWQTCGVICSHIFRIFYHLGIKVIPPKLLKRRLSRGAKRRRASDVLEENDSSGRVTNEGGDWSFNSYVMRTTYDMLHDIPLDDKMKAHLLRGIDSLRDDLCRMAGNGNKEGRRKVAENFTNTAEKPACHDPVVPSKRHHTNTRISRHWEISKRKGKKRAATEIGSRNNIPSPRMSRMSSPLSEDASRASSPATSNFDLPRAHEICAPT